MAGQEWAGHVPRGQGRLVEAKAVKERARQVKRVQARSGGLRQVRIGQGRSI